MDVTPFYLKRIVFQISFFFSYAIILGKFFIRPAEEFYIYKFHFEGKLAFSL